MLDWAPGEALELVDITRERERRQAQQRSILLFSTIAGNSRIMSGEQLTVEEAFPFWTDAEKREIRKERLLARAAAMKQKLLANSEQQATSEDF